MTYSKKKILCCIIISILIILWLLPIYTDGISEVMIKNGTIDGSLKIGLNWSNLLGLKFGKDIIFTYGPLYFLANNYVLSINKPVILIADIFNIILWFLALFLLSLNIANRIDFRDSKLKIISHIVIIAAFIAVLNVFIGLSEILLLVSFLLLFNVLEEGSLENKLNKINTLWLSGAGFLLGIISLIKFVYFILAIALIIISIIIFLIAKKYFHLLPLIVSYLFFLLLFWMLLEKSLLAFFLYLKNSLIISFGYSENVQLFMPGWESKFNLFFVILIFLLWLGVLINGIVKKNKSMIYYFLLSLPIIFLIYKQAFMRQDYYHTQEYFRFIIYLLIFAILIFGKSLWKLVPVFLILFIIALPFKTSYEAQPIREQIAKNSRELKAAVKIFLPEQDNEIKIQLENDKKSIKEEFPIGENIISKIDKDESVDIFTWEIFQLFVNNLKWDPRPVFQSYNAYNPLLDNLNAEHFSEGNNSPEKIIYKVAGLEGRYAIFDEPAVFQELLKNYNFIDFDSFGYGLLEKKENPAEYRKVEISKGKEKFGQEIEVPEVKDGYLFCNIDIKLSLYGKLKNLLYKGDYIFIKFYFEDNSIEPVTKRFVRANGVNGFYLSNYIGDIKDLSDTFEIQNNHKRLPGTIDRIEVFSTNNFSYIEDFNTEFYKLTFPENIK